MRKLLLVLLLLVFASQPVVGCAAIPMDIESGVTGSYAIQGEQPIPASLTFPINVFKAMKNNDIIHMWVPYYITSLKIMR